MGWRFDTLKGFAKECFNDVARDNLIAYAAADLGNVTASVGAAKPKERDIDALNLKDSSGMVGQTARALEENSGNSWEAQFAAITTKGPGM